MMVKINPCTYRAMPDSKYLDPPGESVKEVSFDASILNAARMEDIAVQEKENAICRPGQTLLDNEKTLYDTLAYTCLPSSKSKDNVHRIPNIGIYDSVFQETLR